MWNIDIEFIPVPGDAHTFAIIPSSIVVTTYSLVQFSLTIEEIVAINNNTVTFNSNTQQQFTFNNLLSGNTAINLSNSLANWRINLVGTSLQFQRESPLGSNIWVTKSTLT